MRDECLQKKCVIGGGGVKRAELCRLCVLLIANCNGCCLYILALFFI